MKKAFVVLSLIILLFSMTMSAQSFDVLWKQVEQARRKDLPKTQIGLLGKIERKARREKVYGQLLAATLQSAELRTQISPDSLEVEFDRLKMLAKEAEGKDEVLAAVCNCILGAVSKETDKPDAEQYFQKALANPSLLAGRKAEDFKPLVVSGKDDGIFNNDLLHVMGMQAGDYDRLSRYYAAHGNREAACYTAMLAAEEDEERSSARLDSVMQVYGDLPICGEVAVARYEAMDEDTPAEDRIAFIDKALARWGTWKGIEALRNARRELTASKFDVRVQRHCVTPSEHANEVSLEIRNLTGITLTVTRTTLNGNHGLSVADASDLQKIKAALLPSTKRTIRRTYEPHKDYENFKDSFQMPALPLGVYLVQVESTDRRLQSEYVLYYVTNLFVMTERQPRNRSRYVVVDAGEGQPVAGATLRLTFDRRYGRQPVTKTLTTDKNGEAFLTTEYSEPDVYVCTAGDKACPSSSMYSRYRFYKSSQGGLVAEVYTDRGIYRPGQTLHASAIVYQMIKSGFKTKAEEGRSFDLVVRDANGKEVGRKTVTTDRFGTAAADFELPSGGLTGSYYIVADCGSQASKRFRVEEYKRPTFAVSIDDYKDKYAFGDTIRLKGHARSFAGVPVPGAKVHYTVTRRLPLWWWNDGDATGEVKTEDVVTDEQGDFFLTVPLTLPKGAVKEQKKGHTGRSRFYVFEVEASVTDAAGETRDGSASLPLGTKETALMCALPEKNLRDSLKTIRFDYVNAAGQAVEGTVRYAIVPQQKDESRYTYAHYATARANEAVPIGRMASGAYRLHAVCGTDTVDTDFCIFSMEDRRPVIETHDWFYLSSRNFPRNGGPVYLQVGSSDEKQHVVYSIYAGDRIIESGAFDQDNHIQTRKLVYKEEYGDGIILNYAWVKNGVLYSHEESIFRPLPDKRLIVKWRSFRNRLVPGQQEEWTVTVSRPDGKAADAQLMATLYDKSLDEIVSHALSLSPTFGRDYLSTFWASDYGRTLYLSAAASAKTKTVPELSFSEFDGSFFSCFELDEVVAMGFSPRKNMVLSRAAVSKSMADSVACESKVFCCAEQVPAKNESRATVKYTAPVIKKDEETKKGKVSLRENLNETAFFYPQLHTDGKGNVSFKFTLPESLTTWRFLGLAHDVDMNSGLLTDEAVAQKTLMVQPNMPRFVRVGDEAMISARLFNQSEKPVSADAKVEIIDPETDKVLLTDSRPVVLKAQGSASATYSLAPLLAKDAGRLRADQALLVARFTVEGDGFSDGEQHYLPVLQNLEYVTNTCPFTQHEAGVKTIDVGRLFPKNSSGQKLTVEYTNNPNWLMIQALPYVAKTDSKDAVSLVSAYYANRLGKQIVETSPNIRRTIEQWKKETGKETSMMSALEKNQELKSLALNETPWIMDAASEREQKQMLVRFFDENQLQHGLSTILDNLKKLQNPDGSFSWWPGMDGSLYMTVAVTKTLARLQHLTDKSAEVSAIINASFRYMDREVAKRVAEMKREEKKHDTTLFPTDELCDYLYTHALVSRDKTTADINYLLDRLTKKPADLTIYGKANTAVILQQYNKVEKAREYLQSIKEYTVYTEEMGRYFDTKHAYYSWRDYRIPTEVAAIEAVKTITPADGKTLTEMQRWLLQEKRTQAWDTPLNSVNAIWAFMDNGDWLMQNGEKARLMLDGKPLQMPQPTAGLGYVRATEPVAYDASARHELTVDKSSTGTSWGAVYAQFFQPSAEIADASAGLKVKREVLGDSARTENGEVLKVGDRVRIRLTITADRDYDFVQVIDKRAACLEPVSQLSGYHWGYYIAPKDYTTNYYFDCMRKGKHVVETEYYIDRAGVYQTGTCTVQCAYAPEYSGRTGALQLTVGK